jgi:predicted small integral membrane protein
MVTRISKIALLAGLALFYTLVVFNNLTDFDSNYQFVRHVLSMDTTFPGNRAMYRALTSPSIHIAFYWSIILWEAVTGLLFWWGIFQLARTLRSPAAEFNAAKRVPLIALTFSLLMWLVAFLTIGSEWFLMWQSSTWNGQEVAVRDFTVVGFIYLILLQADTDNQT